jgi:hypothetical protein
MTDVRQLMADLPQPVNFQRLLEQLYVVKFTGQVTLNVGQGCVVSVSLPEKPLIIRLDTTQH